MDLPPSGAKLWVFADFQSLFKVFYFYWHVCGGQISKNKKILTYQTFLNGPEIITSHSSKCHNVSRACADDRSTTYQWCHKKKFAYYFLDKNNSLILCQDSYLCNKSSICMYLHNLILIIPPQSGEIIFKRTNISLKPDVMVFMICISYANYIS